MLQMEALLIDADWPQKAARQMALYLSGNGPLPTWQELHEPADEWSLDLNADAGIGVERVGAAVGS